MATGLNDKNRCKNTIFFKYASFFGKKCYFLSHWFLSN